MREIKQKNYEVTITEVHTYVVMGHGTSKFEAEQDAVERFHRMRKSRDLSAYTVGKPKVTDVTPH